CKRTRGVPFPTGKGWGLVESSKATLLVYQPWVNPSPFDEVKRYFPSRKGRVGRLPKKTPQKT
ncbi:MAG: hypothetical protein LUG18_01670, partial [Candidatus Azobacteroides sp.]|nr:hypothetical protein [Candidatus Azobacteroides sp.]